MEKTNFHKQKLYALIIAGAALIALMLPWISVSVLGMSQSSNGFRGWGILSLIGIAGVAIFTLLENKAEAYSEAYKKYTGYSFMAIGLGALLFLIRKNQAMGEMEEMAGFVSVNTGFGLWLCLAAGIAGIALMFGLIKVEARVENK